LEDLVQRHLGMELRSPDAPPAGQLDLGTGGDGTATEDAGRRAVAVGLLAPVLAEALGARGLRRLYDEI
ncbi:MAG: hypothetical protein C4344_04125, partial [Acidimicrobiia bacterium]